jgi:hypothetical protein
MTITAAQVRSHMAKMGQLMPERCPSKRRGFRSKLESDYAARLTALQNVGVIRSWKYEAVRFKIGNGASFTPDFLVEELDGTIEFHETKGPFAREASIVRIKSAALQYPWCRFYLVTRHGDNWQSERV